MAALPYIMASMPVNLKALQQRILGNKGLHIKLPYPKPFTLPGEKEVHSSPLPPPRYYGLTIRAFFYAPASSKRETKFDIYREGQPYSYYARMIVDGDAVKYAYSGKGWNNEGTTTSDKRIPIPGYYTMAVRFKTGNFFAILYEDEELRAVSQGEYQNSTDWLFRIWATDHYLLSLHLCNEYVSERHFPPQNLEQFYFLGIPVLGPGSRWTMKCIVKEPLEMTDVIILTHFTNGYDKPKDVVRSAFKSDSLKAGDQFTVYVTNSSTFYVITTSFDPKIARVNHGPEPWGNFMHPGVSSNCQILQQYAEQGGITSSPAVFD